MEYRKLGTTDINVSQICLGTMTFGEHFTNIDGTNDILDYAVERGINFIDTAEMYSAPNVRAETYGRSEEMIGEWIGKGNRHKIVLASKVAGPSRQTPWIRKNEGLSKQDIITSCENSLRRLKTDYIDLYQIHWPERYTAVFGNIYFDPKLERSETTILEQLEVLGNLVKQGKIRNIGISNETSYGVHEFISLSEKYGLPKIQSIQNPYSLVNRSFENGLDELCHKTGVSLLAYSPLAIGLLTGKYDGINVDDPVHKNVGRITEYDLMRKRRWCRPEALSAVTMYNNLAREHDISPLQLALGYCYTKWCVTSSIIGIRNKQQLIENINVLGFKLTDDLLAKIDQIRWQIRDPAQ
jgi:aryl-alcohol dehydrogenase-like predicted oxidoreductase